MSQVYKVPLVLTPPPEGGYTVTSPLLPELVTEGDTVQDALDQVRDALQAVVELYEELSKPLPEEIGRPSQDEAIAFDYVVAIP